MSELDALEGWSFPVRSSRGGDVRARSIAEQAERMTEWLNKVTDDFKIPALYVVGPSEWPDVASVPIYGMPHAAPDRIVVGQQPADFWSVLLASIEPFLTDQDRSDLLRVYGEPPTLGGFADLLVSHEMGHYLHALGETTHPTTFWLREMVANLALQGYVSEIDPGLEEVLLTIIRIAWNASRQWPLSELKDMKEASELDGSNYVWFEFGLQTLTRRLWTSAGVAGLRGLINLVNGPALTEAEAFRAIAVIDPGVAADLRRWPRFPAS